MILVLIVSIHVDLHTKNGCDLDFFLKFSRNTTN